MRQTNFDRYLKEQLVDPTIARRFEQAGQAWDVGLQIAALRRQAGLSQKQLAERERPRNSKFVGLNRQTMKVIRSVCCAASPGNSMRMCGWCSNRRVEPIRWPKARPHIVRSGARHQTESHDHGALKSRGTDLLGANEILIHSTHFSSGSISSPTIPRPRGQRTHPQATWPHSLGERLARG